MAGFEGLIGLMVIVLTTAFMLVFTLQDKRSRLPLRRMTAMEHLARAVGIAVEDGRRIHVTFGRGNFFDSHAAITITNTALLKEIASRSTGSDRPVAVSAGDGTSTLLAIDTLDSVPSAGFATERMDARRGRLAGVTALSYAAGLLPALHQEQTSMLVAGGMLGAEMRFILDAAEDESVQILAASDSPAGQAIAFASPVDVLIGEEIFAAPAYLKAGSTYAASLLAEDALRWLLIVAIILGAALISLGMPIL